MESKLVTTFDIIYLMQLICYIRLAIFDIRNSHTIWKVLPWSKHHDKVTWRRDNWNVHDL